jgi:hypothetical protein
MKEEVAMPKLSYRALASICFLAALFFEVRRGWFQMTPWPGYEEITFRLDWFLIPAWLFGLYGTWSRSAVAPFAAAFGSFVILAHGLGLSLGAEPVFHYVYIGMGIAALGATVLLFRRDSLARADLERDRWAA